MNYKELFHFDPLTLVVLLIGFIGAWYTMKSSTAWHTQWIKKHDAECDEQRDANNRIFRELQTANAHLGTMAEGHEKRLDRIETAIDKKWS